MYSTNTPAAELLALEHAREALRDAEVRRAQLAVRRASRGRRGIDPMTTPVTRPRRRWVLALRRATS
jgi:hypothetical protein